MTQSDQYAGFDWLPAHKGELILTHNEHKSAYQSAEEWLQDCEGFGDGPVWEWTAPEERQRAIDADSIWILHWYPDTPVGFYSVAAASLLAIKEWLKNASV